MKVLFRFFNGFHFALNGLLYVLKTQANFRLQLFITLLVISLSFYLRISSTEWLAVMLCIGVVLAAEAFNTAIEKLVDLVSPRPNKEAGIIKDVAAGAVLLLAIMALIIALIIFVPKIF